MAISTTRAERVFLEALLVLMILCINVSMGVLAGGAEFWIALVRPADAKCLFVGFVAALLVASVENVRAKPPDDPNFTEWTGHALLDTILLLFLLVVNVCMSVVADSGDLNDAFARAVDVQAIQFGLSGAFVISFSRNMLLSYRFIFDAQNAADRAVVGRGVAARNVVIRSGLVWVGLWVNVVMGMLAYDVGLGAAIKGAVEWRALALGAAGSAAFVALLHRLIGRRSR